MSRRFPCPSWMLLISLASAAPAYALDWRNIYCLFGQIHKAAEPKPPAPKPPAPEAPQPRSLPSLATALAGNIGAVRPPRPALSPLAARPFANELPREALVTLLIKMGDQANSQAVAYHASGNKSIESQLYAEWRKQDRNADVSEYFQQLTPEQVAIAQAAFDGGMGEGIILIQSRYPERLTLDWVLQNFPPRNLPPAGARNR